MTNFGRCFIFLCFSVFVCFFSTVVSSQPPQHFWSHQSTGTDDASVLDAATDGLGNTYFCGSFTGTANFGAGPLSSAGGRDIFVAKYDANGAIRWSVRYGGREWDSAQGIAVDALGNTIVIGRFGGSVDFGGGPVNCGSSYDAFIAKYDPSGAHMWSRCFGDPDLGGIGFDRDEGFGVTVALDGAIIATGHFDGEVDFGGGPLATADQNAVDIFVVSFDATGSHLWSRRFGGTRHDDGWIVQTHPNGDIFVAGAFEGELDFGGNLLRASGTNDAYVAKLSAGGVPVWSQRFGGLGSDVCNSLVVDTSGDIFICGNFQSSVNFGGGPLSSAGSSDAFLAKYNNQGVHRWSRRFGSVGQDQARSLALDNAGGVVVCGRFHNTVDFGGGPLTSAGADDIFLARFTATGLHDWSWRFGDPDSDSAVDVEIDDTGNVIMVGEFSGALDLGGDLLTSDGGSDVFIAKFGDTALPAALQMFEAYWEEDHIAVVWELTDVEGALSFDIARGDGGRFIRLDAARITRRGDRFLFVDESTEPGTTYYYRVNIREAGEIVTSFEAAAQTPSSQIALGQNFPNPFNPNTRVPFSVDRTAHVILEIHDVRGKHVTTLVDRPLTPGDYSLEWNGRDARGVAVSTGIYFYRLTIGRTALVKKAILLK